MDPWKRRFLLETTNFRGYVSLRECIPYQATICCNQPEVHGRKKFAQMNDVETSS